MHALIVMSHPIANSLTHRIAALIAQGVSTSQPDNTYEIADLAAEGFDPRFNATDVDAHNRVAAISAEVGREQARIDRADALVLVYPVYWWSMPGLLKGWIDRVFANGWAYGEGADGKIEKKLGHVRVHLVAIGGADMRTYARHGYFGAMKLQIDHGIFDYCGAQVVTSELLHAQTQDLTDQLATASRIGERIFARSGVRKLKSADDLIDRQDITEEKQPIL